MKQHENINFPVPEVDTSNLEPVSYTHLEIIKGGVILVALAINAYRQKKMTR